MGNKEICLWFLTCVETVMGDKADSFHYVLCCRFNVVRQPATRQWRRQGDVNVNVWRYKQTNKNIFLLFVGVGIYTYIVG